MKNNQTYCVAFTGLVGEYVGYERKGIYLIRKRPSKRTYPLFVIDFSRIPITGSNRRTAWLPSMFSNEPGKLELKWINRRTRGRAGKTDALYVAAYAESLSQWLLFPHAASRIDEHCIIDLSPFSGLSVHVYIGFVLDNYFRDVSSSQYLGIVEIPSGSRRHRLEA